MDCQVCPLGLFCIHIFIHILSFSLMFTYSWAMFCSSLNFFKYLELHSYKNNFMVEPQHLIFIWKMLN